VSSIVSKTTSIISGICKNVFKTTDNLPKEQIEKLITDAIVEYRASYFNRHSILNIFGQEVKYSLFSGKFVINHSGYDIYISETNKGFYLNIFHRNEKIITHELLNREIIPAEVEKIIAMNIYDYWNSDKNVVGWIKQQIGGPIRSME
jgi:hypothetical protein